MFFRRLPPLTQTLQSAFKRKAAIHVSCTRPPSNPKDPEPLVKSQPVGFLGFDLSSAQLRKEFPERELHGHRVKTYPAAWQLLQHPDCSKPCLGLPSGFRPITSQLWEMETWIAAKNPNNFFDRNSLRLFFARILSQGFCGVSPPETSCHAHC